MDTNDEKPGEAKKNGIPADDSRNATTKKDKLPRKKKKKHNSALGDAARGISATGNVGGAAYKDTDFMNTGTNLSYRE